MKKCEGIETSADENLQKLIHRLPDLALKI